MSNAVIRYWKKSSADYTANGDYILDPLEVKYDSGGINEVETLSVVLQIDKDIDTYDYIEIGGIIGSPTIYDHNRGTKGQLFRIKDIDLDDDDMTMTLSCKLKSTDDLSNTYVYDGNNENVMILDTGYAHGDEALNKLQRNLQIKYDETRNYEFITDITTVTDRVKWEKKSIIDALVSSDDNSFINIWGGELFCKDNKIYLNRRTGLDRGVEILYGKNIDNMKYNINIDSLITRIVPYGYDNISLDGKTPWIDSHNVDKWYQPITVDRTYDKVKLKDKNSGVQDEGYDTIEECRAELIRLAKEEFEKTQCDQPIINIQIDMANVRDTIEYKELGLDQLEEVYKGDTVYCKHYLLGIETKARVQRVIYDVLADEIESVEIGDVTKSFFDTQAKVAQQINEILGEGNTVKGDKVAGIINGLNATFRCQRNLAQKMEILGSLYEDDLEFLDDGSKNPSYGASCIGTKGLMIADSKTADGRDWDWKTFIKAGLVYSEWLVGNLRSVLIKSLNGTSYWDLNNNDLYLDEGRIHGKNFDLNMATGEINISGNATMTGAGLSLNFNTGYIYSQHGKFGNDTTYYDLDNQVLHGDNIDINLKTGYAKIIKGKIGNDTVYFDITNQVIKGDRVTINLKDGTNNLLQAGTVGSTNGRTAINCNDGTAKIGNFSVGEDNKVQVSDGSFTAKDGSKFCKVEAAQISWNDGSRIINNNVHEFNTILGLKETIESLDIIGNTPGGVSISSKAADSIVNVNSSSINASYQKSNEMHLAKSVWVLGDPNRSNYISGNELLNKVYIMSPGDVEVHGDFKVMDGYQKNCVVSSKTFGEVDYHCIEDLYYLLTYTPVEKYYMTKKNTKGYFSIAIRIPLIVQETVRTDMEYNIYITPHTAEDGTPLFARYNVGAKNKDYFIIYSDSPMRFKFKLEARRNKLENADLEHKLDYFNKPKITNENLRKLTNIRLDKKFKEMGLKRDYKLWEKCAKEWGECGECYEG